MLIIFFAFWIKRIVIRIVKNIRIFRIICANYTVLNALIAALFWFEQYFAELKVISLRTLVESSCGRQFCSEMIGKTGNSVVRIILFICPVFWVKKKILSIAYTLSSESSIRWFNSVDGLAFVLFYASLAFNLLWLFRLRIFSKLMQTNLPWTEIFHDNLTQPRSTEKCWFERDLNLHLRDSIAQHVERRPVSRRCKFKSCSRQHFSIDFGSF